DHKKLQDFRNWLLGERKTIQHKVLQIKADAEAIKTRLGLNWADFKGGSRSPLFFFERMGNGTGLFTSISATLSACPDNLEAWSTKKVPSDLIELAFNE